MVSHESFDPGLTQQYTGVLRRAINKDGSFNVRRRGGGLRNTHLYLWLVSLSWPFFFGITLLAYLAVNFLFAGIYVALGPNILQHADADSTLGNFSTAFFFSAHTITTVGYGSIFPKGFAGNLVASIESMAGLMGFALATGLLYGRFSRPSARLLFSEHALVAPYKNITSLQFRLANQRTNALMEIEASVMLMVVENVNGRLQRDYTVLRLERRSIYFLPLTWTVVHPIDESSPLYGRTPEDLEQQQAEVLILVKGFDETFSQTVQTRYSYRYDEILWHARFQPAFRVDEHGHMVLELDQVGNFAKLD